MVGIDADMAGRLQRQLDTEAVRAVQLEGELLRLAPALEHLGGVVLKGAVLAHAAYADPLLRPFTDIDLLVPGDRIEHAISVLGTYGYQRARPEPAPGYDARVGKAVALRHPGGVVIDLHRTLAAGNAGEGIDVDEILAGRRQVPLGAYTVHAPSWEAHLVECALHAVVGDGLARPLSLRDIAEVAHHPWLDAGAVAELALRWQVAELVGLGLQAARDGLGLELPDRLGGAGAPPRRRRARVGARPHRRAAASTSSGAATCAAGRPSPDRPSHPRRSSCAGPTAMHPSPASTAAAGPRSTSAPWMLEKASSPVLRSSRPRTATRHCPPRSSGMPAPRRQRPGLRRGDRSRSCPANRPVRWSGRPPPAGRKPGAGPGRPAGARHPGATDAAPTPRMAVRAVTRVATGRARTTTTAPGHQTRRWTGQRPRTLARPRARPRPQPPATVSPSASPAWRC